MSLASMDLNVRYGPEGFRWMSFPADEKGYSGIERIVGSNFLEKHKDYILLFRRSDTHEAVWLPTTETFGEYNKRYGVPNRVSAAAAAEGMGGRGHGRRGSMGRLCGGGGMGPLRLNM